MKYHFVTYRDSVPSYGENYICNHPVYSRCTLFRIKNKGLAVIQQYYEEETKRTYWDSIDPKVVDDIYLHPNFYSFFESRASEMDSEGLYSTVTVRQIMWALRMKPLPKHRWETVFDRRDI